jgi:hypothetical protein
MHIIKWVIILQNGLFFCQIFQQFLGNNKLNHQNQLFHNIKYIKHHSKFQSPDMM